MSHVFSGLYYSTFKSEQIYINDKLSKTLVKKAFEKYDFTKKSEAAAERNLKLLEKKWAKYTYSVLVQCKVCFATHVQSNYVVHSDQLFMKKKMFRKNVETDFVELMDLNPEFGFLSQMHPFYFIEVSKDEELNKQIFSNWIFKEKFDFTTFLKDQLDKGNRLKGLPYGFEFIKY